MRCQVKMGVASPGRRLAAFFVSKFVTSPNRSLFFFNLSPTAHRVGAAGGLSLFWSECVVSGRSGRAASGSLNSSLRASVSRRWLLVPGSPLMYGFARLLLQEEGWLAQSSNGHCRPCAPRALPTACPRRSNSCAVMLSRSIIESLTRSFLAAAVFATAFGFFFASRL